MTFPKHGELRGSDRWDKASGAWVPADEWQRRQWAREDAAFARQANQGELKCPMILRDSMKPVQSQVSGKVYDSKSAIRREYRETGHIEVGDHYQNRFKRGEHVGRFSHGDRPHEDPKADREREAAMRKFHQFLDIGGERITKIVHDEDGMKRLRHQGKA